MEACEVCGFEWDAITAGDVPARIRAAADGFRVVLGGNAAELRTRPSPNTWSVIEYSAHVRDVMLNLRDRIVVGLAEDNPTPKAMFTDVRIASGLYASETPDGVATGIDVGADLLARTVEALSAEQLGRQIFYPWPRTETRTLMWVAAQALHEAEHHLADVRSLTSA